MNLKRQALENWVSLLAEAESGNNPSLRILDTNDKYSHGCLQFQFPTFRHFATEYELVPGADDAGLRREIYNCASQRKLAVRMIEEDYDNWRHWRNTVRKIGKPPRSPAAKKSSRSGIRTDVI